MKLIEKKNKIIDKYPIIIIYRNLSDNYVSINTFE